jgi:hypothetical protein
MLKRLALVTAFPLLVSGCAGRGAPEAPAVATPQPAATNTTFVTAPATLVPVQLTDLGVSFSYPDQATPPERTEIAGGYTLLFPTWEFTVFRREAPGGKDLGALAKEHMQANTQASSGRIVSTDLGQQTLGGKDAWAIKSHFDSAAGRTDWLHHIVLAGGYQYVVSCHTKQGPPVVPWESVAPACKQVLATVSFQLPPEPLVRLSEGQVRLPDGIVGIIPSGLNAADFSLLLDGVSQETASIAFEECSAQAPDSGCVSNHRAINVTRTVTVAGRPAPQFEAVFQRPAAANDPRSWLELHTVVTLPSGRKVDIIGQALDGSGAAPRLRAAYAVLLESLRLDK